MDRVRLVRELKFAVSSLKLFSKRARFSVSMKEMNSSKSQVPPSRNWSNRILAASLFGIFFFTLFPYRVDFTLTPDGNRNPFTLSGPLQFDGTLHTFLNTLLFVPLGLGLFAFTNRRRKSWLKSLSVALVVGSVLSYSIEIVQMYMPTRDSAWDDVIANAAGAVLGMLLALAFGEHILSQLSKWEKRLASMMRVRTVGILALVYFAFWLVISVPLQHKSQLSNWDPNSFLSIGNDIRGQTPWLGEISRLEIWDKSLDVDQAAALAAHSNSSVRFGAGVLAAYNFSEAPPIQDQIRSLPDLSVRSVAAPGSGSSEEMATRSRVWLVSETPLSVLSRAVRRSNRVSFLLDCTPKGGEGSEGTLVDISTRAGDNDFSLEQRGATLVIKIRTGLDPQTSSTNWNVDDVFTAQMRRSVLLSYDGADGVLYVDGKKEGFSYDLSPGAGLVHQLIRVKASELTAYNGLYKSLVFLPIAFSLGLAVRVRPRQNILSALGICFCIVFPAILLEGLLVEISGKRMSITQMGVSIGLTIAGMIWINLDSAVSSSTP
jgi:glycopeptide antibiotics resistance protein